MTGLVFVDANILLYAVDTRDPIKHARANEWMARLWREQSGRTGVQVLNEFYANATRVLDPSLTTHEAWGHVDALIGWNPQPVDTDVLALGYQIQTRYRLSWWDSLVVAAANKQACALLLTEDLHHSAVYAGVTVLNPFRSGIQEPAEVYAAQIRPAPRRSRGRPRTRPVPT
jgi:predicted nucleic acid-binding protein